MDLNFGGVGLGFIGRIIPHFVQGPKPQGAFSTSVQNFEKRAPPWGNPFLIAQVKGLKATDRNDSVLVEAVVTCVGTRSTSKSD